MNHSTYSKLQSLLRGLKREGESFLEDNHSLADIFGENWADELTLLDLVEILNLIHDHNIVNEIQQMFESSIAFNFLPDGSAEAIRSCPLFWKNIEIKKAKVKAETDPEMSKIRQHRLREFLNLINRRIGSPS